MTAQPYDRQLAGDGAVLEEHHLRGAALIVVLLVLVVLACGVLASTEWIAPAGSVAVPG